MGIASVGGHIIRKIRSPLDVRDSQSEAASVGGLFHFEPNKPCRYSGICQLPGGQIQFFSISLEPGRRPE
jgi:hypothetical protein